MLIPGTPAPTFEAKTHDDRDFNLTSYVGKKVWLCFYRYAGCPLCNFHVAQVIQKSKLLNDNGVEVVMVFESRPDQFPKKLKDLKTLEVKWIADPKKNLYSLYNLESSLWAVLSLKVVLKFIRALLSGFTQKSVQGELGQVPAHFLIREDGLIHSVYYGTDIADQIPWWQVERFVNEESVEEWKRRTGVLPSTLLPSN